MQKYIDLTGQTFGRLTVIERDKNIIGKKGTYWVCKCSCGNKKSILGASLRRGATLSCGCLNKEINSRPKEITDMIGKTFGHLTVKERAKTHVTPSGQKKTMWLCQCDCGKECVVCGADLKSGHTKSCGHIPTREKGDGICLIDLVGKRFGKLVVRERAEDYTYINTARNKVMTSPQWLCDCDCGNTVICQGGNLRNGNATSCGCANKASIGEIKVAEFLTKNKVKYLREYTFDDLRNESGNLLRFDFAILDDEDKVIMLVEYQGEQHYKDCGTFGLYQRQYSDKAKREYCEGNGIPLYEIRFNCDLEKTFLDLLNEIKMYKKISA